MPSPAELTYIHEVANAVESVVIANATPGRWRAGDNSRPHEWSTLRTIIEGDGTYHLGTAIEKPNQRAMMGGQPQVLAANVTVLRAVDEATPAGLTATIVALCQWYNKTMSLGVDESSLTATPA
ncbi:hypothetical protein [Gordonia alkanivorans]|uniref:hypothetical protein n=1 Tax=Gordonia alkanivorans TaxID=84096 RepID=UPI0004B67638|nr:hypothetical protein [Gordonia alkanivorans]